ncbi:MAG: transporter substrate-binding domain-containing protein [Desulfobacula sp.]|nr:transporter substrate-binding domain-containing protein [Desulfobacula sp.]
MKVKIIIISIVFSLIFILALAHDQEIEISRKDLKLTPAEKTWLQKHQTIRIAGPRSFPPFHYFEKNGDLKGISADYIYLIMNLLGVKVQVQENFPWPEVLKRAQTGKIDLIPCAAKTVEREAYLSFSRPYLSFPLVILTRKDAPFIGGIEDLHGKKLAIVKKKSTVEWLERDDIDFIPHYVESVLKGLEAVSFGRADVYIENLAAAGYLIQKNGLTNLKIAAPTPYGNYNLHMAVRKNLPELLGIINKTLDVIPPEKHIEIRNKWLSIRYEHGIKKTDVIKWILIIIFFSVGILTMVLIWNQRLKKESYERKLTEEKLRVNEKKYRHLFKNAPAGIYEVDFEKTKFINVNEVMCAYTGYSEKEFLSMSPFDLLTQDSKKLFAERLEKLFSGEKVSNSVEFDIIKKDGEKLSVILNIDFVYKNKKLVGARVVVHDITDRKKAEEEKITAQKLAGEHEKLALVGQIAGKMAHDFNNILGIIMGNTELFLLDCKDEETKKILKLIFNQTLRGKNLTKNLIAFARDQEPKQAFFRINEKIDLVLSLLKKDLEGIELIKEDKPGVPDLLADPGMIEHALVNLVQNSIHAVSRVEHPLIIIRTYCLNDNICFEIEDNGCGIPREHIGRIYEPSFTLKGSCDVTGSYRTGIKGTGYGMSNIKKYINQHKGRIFVESAFGSGTKFTISLPVIKKELTKKEKTQIKKEIIHFEKYILVVEDEAAISDIQYRILTQEPCNHKVDIAQNGQIAIDLFKRNKYDFVSLDYILPGKINGMDVYHHIRKADKNIPILFVSGNIEFLESIKELKQKDINIDHLSKPCRNKEYVNSINRLLKRKLATS